jgi:hypothetical protein
MLELGGRVGGKLFGGQHVQLRKRQNTRVKNGRVQVEV